MPTEGWGDIQMSTQVGINAGEAAIIAMPGKEIWCSGHTFYAKRIALRIGSSSLQLICPNVRGLLSAGSTVPQARSIKMVNLNSTIHARSNGTPATGN